MEDRRTERVLVVDDHEPVARTIVRWLERDGFRSDVAHSLREAIVLIERHDYDIVFADVHLGPGSGLQLARTLKDRDPAVQVIMITGSTTLETAVEALRLDADDYLVKPLEADVLRHAVRRAAEHRRLILENRSHRTLLETRVKEQATRLEGLYLSSIHSLVGALEAKDPHTRGHSERVAEYAVALAEFFPDVDTRSLRAGARLHDIGKIGIRGGILRKDGPLTTLEMSQVRQHPTIGVQILSPLLEDPVALGVVRHHHEWWDGSGYPAGLAAEQIPLGARIVSVADTFDAMTTSRPYRAARTPDQAVAEIRAQAGRQFDPAVARHAAAAFLGSLDMVS